MENTVSKQTQDTKPEETDRNNALTPQKAYDALKEMDIDVEDDVEKVLATRGGHVTRAGLLISRTVRSLGTVLMNGVIHWVCITFMFLASLKQLETLHVITLTLVALAQLIAVGTKGISHGQKGHPS